MDYTKGTYITWAKYDESPEIMTFNGDIIFCKTASVGKVALVKDLPYKATINPQLVVLKDIQCNAGFLTYVLGSDTVQKKVISIAGIGSVPNVSQKALSELEIPIPPLPVQEEIVRVLDTFTELQAELQAELQKRLQQYNYYRDKLLTFDGREDVEWRPLVDCCLILDGKRKPITKGARESGQYPYYGANGIQDYVADYIFDGTFILVGEDGSVITPDGKPVVNWAEGKIWVNNHAHILAEKPGVLLRFLYYYIQTIDIHNLVHGNIPKLTQGDLKDLSIPSLPLDEQEKIVKVLDRFDALTFSLSQGLPAEIEKRRQQYEFYRDKLLTFKRKEA